MRPRTTATVSSLSAPSSTPSWLGPPAQRPVVDPSHKNRTESAKSTGPKPGSGARQSESAQSAAPSRSSSTPLSQTSGLGVPASPSPPSSPSGAGSPHETSVAAASRRSASGAGEQSRIGLFMVVIATESLLARIGGRDPERAEACGRIGVVSRASASLRARPSDRSPRTLTSGLCSPTRARCPRRRSDETRSCSCWSRW